MNTNKHLNECTCCLYTDNHPFGLRMDSKGVCSGCAIHLEKDQINWDKRFYELVNLLKPYKSNNGAHDCVIHIDGSAQSYYVVHLTKNIIGMNPLLVNYNSHYLTDIGIRNMQQLITSFDLNLYQFTLDSKEYKNFLKKFN